MREILFRGMCASGEWVEGDLFINNRNNLYLTYIRYPVNDISYSRAKVLPETVGQYTGLTDKNGKKIFEGDIVKMLYKDDLAEIGPIMWSDVGLRYKFASSDGTSYSFDCTATIEVIGNIHDNPELLKGGE
jgi:uncharacterized phage protein (TIGR01671 family)